MSRLLEVRVLEARNVIACDRGGTSDPYVVLTLNDIAGREIKGERQKTEKINKTLNPRWNATLTLGSSYDLNNTDALPTLSMKVYDHDTWGSDTPMGMAEIPLHQVDPAGAPYDEWLPLQPFARMQDVTGEIHVSVRFLSPPGAVASRNSGAFSAVAAAAPAPLASSGSMSAMEAGEVPISLPEDDPPELIDEDPNELHVVIIRGRNLPIMDKAMFGSGGSSDPLVILKCGGETRKTAIKKKNLNPVWNENFHFDVASTSEALELIVEDDDLTMNDFMGKVVIPLQPLADKHTERRWYRLLNDSGAADGVDRGEIEVAVKWKHNPANVGKKKRGLLGLPSFRRGDDESEAEDDDDDALVKEPELSAEDAEKLKVEKEEAEKALKEELGAIEIKSGDYQVQVHIIEARDLKAEDLEGTSDPVVYIECFGQKQNTEVKKKCLSCVWDEVFIFNMRNLDKEEFEMGVIRISVMDADTFSKNDLIGAYAFDASYVYFQKDHEIYRKWVALMDDEDPEDTGVQGYLKISVQIIGPGEKAKVHDEAAELAKEMAAEAAGNIESMVLMPPTIKKETVWLVTSVYRAEYLPVMDTNGLGRGGIDAYYKVEFAGGKALKTKTKTVKGDRSALNPEFNYELWYPVTIPTMTQNVRYTMCDHNTVAGDDIVGTVMLRFGALDKMPNKTLPPFWANLYGANEEAGANVLKKFKQLPGIGMNWKDQYNKLPEQAPSYKGRVLVAAKIATQDQVPAANKSDDIQPFRRKIKKLAARQEPPSRVCKLMALVCSGTEMPKFVDLSRPGKHQKLQIRVSLHRFDLLTQRVDNNNGVCEWNELLESEDLVLPQDLSQCPDIFVYLCQGKEAKPICFKRFKAEELFNNGFQRELEWISLGEDKSIDALDDGEFPGSVLVKLGFGTVDDAVAAREEYRAALGRLKARRPYQLRVHIYQGRDLPAADSNGLLDPFVKVNFMGEQKKGKLIKECTDPLWYETLVFDCDLPDMEFAPQINVQVWDWDQFDSDDYVGMFFLNVRDAFVMQDLNAPASAFPSPKWYSLFTESPGDGEGEVLISAQLVPKRTPTDTLPPPPPITPALRPAFLEIIALGCRDLLPYNFLPMQLPFLEFEVDSVSGKETTMTGTSRKPTPANPNFLERVILPVQLPENSVFAPRLKIRCKDTRLGGFNIPVVGVCSVDLVDKLPWSPNYVPPQADGLIAVEKMAGAPVIPEDPEEKKARLPPLIETDLEEKEEKEEEKELTVDDIIEQRLARDDNGAGVFGGLKHVQVHALEKKATKKKRTGEDYFADADELFREDDEEETPAYLIDRPVLSAELEEELKTCPFESHDLCLGQKNGVFGSTFRKVGRFKGLIRVMLNENDPPLFDLNELLKPKPYKIRLYVLRGIGLTPMDMGIGGRPGKSDPYLLVELGKEKFNDRENKIDDVTEADFYKLVELNAELPGASQLKINVMDHDDIGSDDLIGRTVIDLEDRWFDARWQRLGRENRVSEMNRYRWDTKPLERRALYVPTSNNPQGTLECWVDIMNPAEAGQFPPDDVALPPTAIFEVRVIVWKTKDVVAMDTLENMNDLFVRAWIEGCDYQDTDTHWRCKKGKGSFNWRMKFDVELGHNTRAMKFPYLRFQMWDKDILKWNDCIAEGTVNLGKYFKKAYRKNVAIKLFEQPKGSQKKRKSAPAPPPKPVEEEEEKEEEQTADEHKPLLLDDTEQPADMSPLSAAEEGDTGVGILAANKDADAAAGPAAPVEAKPRKSASKPKSDEKSEPKMTAKEKLANMSEKEAPQSQKEEDDAELKEFINQVKEMTGLWEIDPPDSAWLPMTRMNHNTGVVEPMGKLAYSVQIWPKEKAKVMAVGSGRNEPNSNPFLPPPTGRLKFTLNPFVMGSQLCGPVLCAKIFCCLMCLAFLAVMIFFQPAFNLMIAIFST